MDHDDADEHTCGKGIAMSADLPDSFAVFMRAMSALLDNHTRSLDPTDPGGRTEIEGYRSIVAAHRVLAEDSDELAADMRTCRDIPAAGHNMDVLMDQTSIDVFVALVEAERNLLAILQARVHEHDEMIAAMRQA